MLTWNYPGSTSISITTDTIAGHSYIFSCTDASTMHSQSFTGTGSPMTSTITGLSGLSSGDAFGGKVQDDTTKDFLGANNFNFGTASTDGGGISGVWTFDGASTFTLTFTGVAGVSYNLQVNYYSGGSAFEEYGTPFTATGSPQLVSLTAANTPALDFIGSLWLNQDTFTSPSSRVFDAGTSGAGSPGNPGGDGPAVTGRVLIAWDDGPLVADPTWTAIDQGGDFPDQFVSGFDTHVGRQTLTSQTETGTATVYVNDRSGLFDDRNMSSPYQGKLSGRQIMLQIFNPVSSTWEPQFRGLIDDYRYDIDGSAVDVNGDPINASIQIECVDVFDYLNGYGLTPGLDGDTPPTGAEDSVYYLANGVGDTVATRILQILTDANVDPSMSFLASGNIQVIATQYNADESALTALRDCADAELPFIGNIYVDRRGLFCFRGRYSRFAPDDVAAEPGSTWDFTRWPVGDGKAILADATRAQIRILSYSRDRGDLVNAALCYPQGTQPADIPGQVFANSASITAYGKHQLNPITDLIVGTYVGPGTISPDDGITQCALYAELLVKNKKDPRICPTAVQLKTVHPTDSRATTTWDTLTKCDIGHIVNIAVGYPGGTGLAGDSPDDDYYIEGKALVVRPLDPTFDYVELNLEVSPFVWSADTHSVFPAFGS
jgi:hypothetical protein